MDFQVLLTIIFVVFLAVLLFVNRRKIQLQGIFPLFYFAMYRTKLGLGAMDRIAKKCPGFLKGVVFAGVVLGFLGMLFITVELVRNSLKLFTEPGAAAGIQPVLPFAAKGVFYVPFMFWILSIFIIAVIHEFSHGVATRLANLPVKSSGFAFLGILFPIVPAAFVEPDEKKLLKAKTRHQLGVFAAGPFSNLLTAGLVFLIIVFLANPLAESMLDTAGIKISSVEDDSPASRAGLEQGMVITAADSISIDRVFQLTQLLKEKKQGDAITLATDKGAFEVILGSKPGGKSAAHIGIQSKQHAVIRESFSPKWLAPVILWFFGLIYWLFLLSLGIGLFNLLPMGPLDGGRMIQAVLKKMFNDTAANLLWKGISWALFILVIANVLVGFLL